MIYSLRGTVCVKTAFEAVIEVAGVGYKMSMSTTSLASLPALGEEAYVLTYLAVRDDGLSLFGFVNAEERELFCKLIGVSGVGPKVALSALSTFAPAALRQAVAAGDVSRIATIPGVGKKTAQRIVLELKGAIEATLEGQLSLASSGNEAAKQSREALLGMGFSSAEVELALQGYDGEVSSAGEYLRYALKRLGQGTV